MADEIRGQCFREVTHVDPVECSVLSHRELRTLFPPHASSPFTTWP